MTFTPAELDALEKPVPKVRVGRARKGAPTERTIQRETIKALSKLGLWAVHVPNEGKLTGGELARWKQTAVLKADGMTRGALDLIVMGPRGVGWLEIKKPGGVLSAAQLGFMARLDRLGIPCAAVCSVEDALRAVQEWWG